MDVAVLTGVLLLAFAFAAAPHLPLARRLLRIPDDGQVRRPRLDVPARRAAPGDALGGLVRTKRGSAWPLRPLSGTYARVTSPGMSPLAVVPESVFLHLASSPAAAWASLLHGALGVDGLVHAAPRQLVIVEVEGLAVVDFTDPQLLQKSGLDPAAVLSQDQTVRRRLVEEAVFARAGGVQTPSRYIRGATDLSVFLGRVPSTVKLVSTQVIPLGLRDAVGHPALRALFSDDDAALAFQRMLHDGRFAAWRAELKSELEPDALDEAARLGMTLVAARRGA